MAQFAKKKITQELFDETVRENMEDFEMPMAEAIQDSIKQFVSQGVDLEDIDVSGGIGREELLARIQTILEYQEEKVSEGVIEAANDLIELMSEKNELHKRNRNVIFTKGVLDALIRALFWEENVDKLKSILGLCIAMVPLKDEYRDSFEPNGSHNIHHLLTKVIQREEYSDVIYLCMKLCKIVAKSENTKVMLMKEGVGKLVYQILVAPFDESNPMNINIMGEACLVLRGLCIHDDSRQEMSCAYDNGRYFIGEDSLPEALMGMSHRFEKHPKLAANALAAARALITTEEAVKIMAEHGAMEIPKSVLTKRDVSLVLVKSTLGLTRNLCNDDRRKNKLVSDGTMQLIVAALDDDQYQADGFLLEHGIACLAAMSLRSPHNSQQIMGTGAATVIVKCMTKHPGKPSLQRQACLLIRNVAARCPDQRNVLLDAGMENAVRSAGMNRSVVDEAYAALRDLGCAVQVVQVSEDGSMQKAFEEFGAKPALKFNPVFEESNDINHRVQKEATAPFALPRVDEDDCDDDHCGSGGCCK